MLHTSFPKSTPCLIFHYTKHACAGLSGVYDIMEHYEHEKTRGVEYISAMHKAMDGIKNFESYSPTARIRKLNKEQLERYTTNLFD